MALMAVEHGAIEQTSPNKFRAAIAFYPPCHLFRGDVTVPTLILIGERDDVNPAAACRDMVDGRDDMGISRRPAEGVPIKLVVYPGAYHAFDALNLKTPREISGHHLEFNQSAADQLIEALHDFLDATIGALISYDRKRTSALTATLLSYFDSNQNATITAQRLQIHVNTVRQRLATIEDLIGHWGNASRALETYVALRLWSLRSPAE